MMRTCSVIKPASRESISLTWLMICMYNRIFPLECYEKCNGRQSKASGFKGLAGTRKESGSQISMIPFTLSRELSFLPVIFIFQILICAALPMIAKMLICVVAFNIFTREITLALCINHWANQNILSGKSVPLWAAAVKGHWLAIWYWLVFLSAILL